MTWWPPARSRGFEEGRESVSLANVTAADIDLTGWTMTDRSGTAQSLSGTIASGGALRVPPHSSAALGNRDGC